MASKTFSDIILSSNNLNQTVNALRRAYQTIKNKIVSGKYPDLYSLTATRNGITKDVVMLLGIGARSKAVCYAEFEDEGSSSLIDTTYYMKSVRSVLRGMCKSIGLPDESYVVNS